jgi:hypothetical protein
VEVSAFAADGKPPSDDYWWVPQLGFNGGYGLHLFDTREAAMIAAHKKIETQIDALMRLRANIYS